LLLALQIASIAAGIIFTRSTGFRFGNFHIQVADVSGKPVHFTFALATQAMEQALKSGAGTIQSGDIAVTISLWGGT
jgi:hypothetical protein